VPRVVIINASEASQRRLLSETIERYQKKGFMLSGRKEGGFWQDVLTVGQNQSLFVDRQLLVVESAEDLGPLPKEMAPFFQGDESSTVLLVYEGSPSKYIPREALRYATVLKADEIPFWPSARLNWLLGLCKNEGIKIDREAASLLVEWIEDGEELRSEIMKLGFFAKGQVISPEIVKALSFDEGRNSLLRLLDGLCQGDREEILKAFPHLRDSMPFLPLVAAIYNRFRPVLYQAFFPSLPEKQLTSFLNIRNYAWKMAAEAKKNYSKEDLSRFLVELIAFSYGEKTGLGKGWLGLETSILKLLSQKRTSHKKS
jgi:DNA polymerase III delta subunit